MNAKAMWFRTKVLAAVVAAVAGHGAAAQSPISPTFLIAHVRVFDGERVQENTQVAIEGGIIRAVGRDLTAWGHLPVIDGTGATLLPGLIGAGTLSRGRSTAALSAGFSAAYFFRTDCQVIEAAL
jgi:hypothetical protein